MGKMTASQALERLKAGNAAYLAAQTCGGDISPEIRAATCAEGQAPYAVIIACSDSRVIPEAIFNAGIGELFVIRVAGNVMDHHQLGSVEYAVEHLGTQLVVVLGHDHCGAVDAALHHSPAGHIKHITDEIRRAAGNETDPLKVCLLNVRQSVGIIRQALDAESAQGVQVCGALYRIGSGAVEFLD